MAKPHHLEISFYPTTSSPVYKTPEILPPLFSSISCPETLNMFKIFKFSFPLFFKKGENTIVTMRMWRYILQPHLLKWKKKLFQLNNFSRLECLWPVCESVLVYVKNSKLLSHAILNISKVGHHPSPYSQN